MCHWKYRSYFGLNRASLWTSSMFSVLQYFFRALKIVDLFHNCCLAMNNTGVSVLQYSTCDILNVSVDAVFVQSFNKLLRKILDSFYWLPHWFTLLHCACTLQVRYNNSTGNNTLMVYLEIIFYQKQIRSTIFASHCHLHAHKYWNTLSAKDFLLFLPIIKMHWWCNGIY